MFTPLSLVRTQNPSVPAVLQQDADRDEVKHIRWGKQQVLELVISNLSVDHGTLARVVTKVLRTKLIIDFLNEKNICMGRQQSKSVFWLKPKALLSRITAIHAHSCF